MIIWVIGILFTMGFVLSPYGESPSTKDQILLALLIIFLWPVILGLEFQKENKL